MAEQDKQQVATDQPVEAKSAPAKSAQPSLADILAKQRAEAGSKFQQKTGTPPSAAPAPAAPAPAAAAPVPAAPASAAPATTAPDAPAPASSPAPAEKPQPSAPAAAASTASAPTAEPAKEQTPAPERTNNHSDIANIVASSEIGAVDQSEIDKLSPAEAEMVRQMLAETKPEPVAAPAAEPAPEQPVAVAAPVVVAVPGKHSMLFQLAVVLNTVAVGLLFVIAFLIVRTHSAPAQATLVQPATSAPAPAVAVEKKSPTEELPPELAPGEGVSFQQAQKAYTQKQYKIAAYMYERLLETARQTGEETVVRDYFQLRAAECHRRLQDSLEARNELGLLLDSPSAAVRATAAYQLAAMDEEEGQYVRARMLAYQASAAASFLNRPGNLQRDCDFIVAQAISHKALAMSNSDAEVRWPLAPEVDFFQDLNEVELKTLLHEGAVGAGGSVLGATIEPVSSDGIGRRWSVRCVRSPLEELLSRVSGITGGNIQWSSLPAVSRKRAVTMRFANISGQQAIEIASGAVGAIARFDGDKAVVLDPEAIADVADQRNAYLGEAVACWRRIFLRYGNDSRIATGHYVLGLLYESSESPQEAIAEFQSTAGRYSHDAVAPQALLRCATIQMNLRDFAGARSLLTRLLDTYPDCSAIDQAYLALGQASLEAGAVEDAWRIFRRLRNMDVSPEARTEACYGAGRSLFLMGKYSLAADWLTEYLKRTGYKDGENVASAMLLLGRCYAQMKKYADASAAFQQAMANSDESVRPQILLETADALANMGRFAAAVGAIDQAQKMELDVRQQTTAAVLRAKVMRQMELPEAAASILRRQIALSEDAQTRIELSVELARCLAAADDEEEAYKILSEVLPYLSAGADAQNSACDLAQLCLDTGKPAQAITLCQAVLKTPADAAVRARANSLLASAYMAQRKFRQADLALETLKPAAKETAKP